MSRAAHLAIPPPPVCRMATQTSTRRPFTRPLRSHASLPVRRTSPPRSRRPSISTSRWACRPSSGISQCVASPSRTHLPHLLHLYVKFEGLILAGKRQQSLSRFGRDCSFGGGAEPGCGFEDRAVADDDDSEGQRGTVEFVKNSLRERGVDSLIRVGQRR